MEPVTPNPAHDLTVTDVKPPTVRDEVKRSLLDSFKSLPGWAQIALVAVAVVSIAAWRHFNPTPAPVVNVTVPTPELVTPASVGSVISDAETSRREGHKLFAKVIRNRVASQLKTDGFALVGGNAKPLTHMEAWSLLGNLEDSAIVAAAVETGKVGEGGGLLDSLAKVLQFLVDHKDQILAIIKIVMALLAVFGDPVAWGVIQGPDGPVVWAQYPDQFIMVAV